MPAPKAVLCDIVDLGLDPQARHVRCSTDGRLARTVEPQPIPASSAPEEVINQHASNDSDVVDDVDREVATVPEVKRSQPAPRAKKQHVP